MRTVLAAVVVVTAAARISLGSVRVVGGGAVWQAATARNAVTARAKKRARGTRVIKVLGVRDGRSASLGRARTGSP
jgi:hypothetical protein